MFEPKFEKCICKSCKRTIEFKQFRELLPEKSRQEFTNWYSGMFDDLEHVQTELAWRIKNSESDFL